MSEGIHYNPFEAVRVTPSEAGAIAETLPSKSNAKAIRSIGLFFFMFSLVGILFSLITLLVTIPKLTNPQAQPYGFYDESLLVLRERNLVSCFTASFNSVLSIVMLITAIGLLRNRGWATRAGVFVSLAAILYKLMECFGE